MPTYEYLCSKCSNQYEKREGFDAPAQQKCPSCGGKARRVIHAAPIVFKGSGFYVTDSRKQTAGSSDGAGESGGPGSSNGDASTGGTSSEPTSSGDSSTKDTEAAAAS